MRFIRPLPVAANHCQVWPSIAIAGIAASAWACPANAQTVLPGGDIGAFFGTEFGDAFSSRLLNQLFGPLFPTTAADAGPTIFSALVGLVNMAVLLVAGLMFLYNISAGLLQSAHEGEVLGRRWSSLWAPLRVLFAVALLIPVPGLGGYNAIQTGTAWLVKGSTMMASAVWGEGARLLLSGDIPVSGRSPQLDGDLFKAVYRNQLCARIANFQFEAANSGMRVAFVEVRSGEEPRFVSAINGKRQGICGSYLVPEVPSYVARLPDDASLSIRQSFNGLHADVLRILVVNADRMIDRQWQALLANDSRLPDLSGQIASMMAEANSRLAAGNRAIMAAVAGSDGQQGAARGTIEAFVTGGCRQGTTCAGEGWIGAGNWYMTLARLNSEVMGLVNASVSARDSRYISGEMNRLNRAVVATADSVGWFPQLFAGFDAGKYLHIEEAMRLWEAANGNMEAAAARLAGSGFSLPEEVLETAAPSERSGLLGKIWRAGFADGVQAMIAGFSPSRWGDDPIVGVVNMGNWYLDVAGALMLGGAAASVFSGAAANVVILLIAAPLAAIGITQSFILPLLPFLFWIVAVIGYFLLVAEAVVGSSLWALSHLRLDGEGISGEAGRQGWLMLLALVMTPALMVMGYLLGMEVFRIMAGLLDSGMYYAMSALVNASPLVGIFGLIAAGLLIVASYVVIIERSFSLVSEFPGRTLRWIGADARIADGPELHGMQRRGANIASGIGAGVTRLAKAMPGGGNRQVAKARLAGEGS